MQYHTYKINTYGTNIIILEEPVCKLEKQRRFSNPGIPDNDELEDVVTKTTEL